MAEALLAVLIFLPAALTFLLKSDAALAFLSFCGGFAVITLSGSDIEHLVGQTKITSLTSNDVDLILLLAPTLLTLIFTFRAVSSQRLRFVQLLPALAAGVLLAVIAGPMMSSTVGSDITKMTIWRNLKDAQSYIVGAGLLLSLLLIWTGGFLHAKSNAKKHK
jgi:hypothetical protein